MREVVVPRQTGYVLLLGQDIGLGREFADLASGGEDSGDTCRVTGRNSGVEHRVLVEEAGGTGPTITRTRDGDTRPLAQRRREVGDAVSIPEAVDGERIVSLGVGRIAVDLPGRVESSRSHEDGRSFL